MMKSELRKTQDILAETLAGFIKLQGNFGLLVSRVQRLEERLELRISKLESADVNSVEMNIAASQMTSVDGMFTECSDYEPLAEEE